MLFIGKQTVVGCNRVRGTVIHSHSLSFLCGNRGAGWKTQKPRPFPSELETRPTHQPFVRMTKLERKEMGKYVLFKHLHGGFAETE